MGESEAGGGGLRPRTWVAGGASWARVGSTPGGADISVGGRYSCNGLLKVESSIFCT